ncbi:EFR1 family ferrodoxin [Sulfurospirillum sp.]|nr:EFR1 family ferrodoxin [Sulfurospirillum sp.]
MEFKRVKMVYFSPTKTTKKVLKSIASGIGVEEIIDFDLTYPNDIEQATASFCDELVIIGAPVYAGRLPVVAVERFKQLRAKNTLAIIVVVYGNRDYEDALLELKNLVIESGFTPVAGGAFVAEHSYSTDDTPIAKGRPDSLDMQNAIKFAQKIRNKIKTLPTSQIDLKVSGNFPYKDAMLPNTVAPVVDEKLCSQCGECIEVCPTGAIFLEDSIVTKTELCVRCCACIRSCPSEARMVEDIAWKSIGARLNANCSTRKEPELFL